MGNEVVKEGMSMVVDGNVVKEVNMGDGIGKTCVLTRCGVFIGVVSVN